MKKKTIISLFLSGILLSSCDKTYDLNNIDKTVEIGNQLDIPLIWSKDIKLKDYFTFNIPTSSMTGNSMSLEMPQIPVFVPSTIVVENEVSSMNTMTVKVEDIPTWVNKVNKVKGNCTYDVSFAFTQTNNIVTKIHLTGKDQATASKKAITVSFPEWIKISSCSDSRFVIDGNNLVLNQSISVDNGAPLSFSVAITELTPSAFSISGGKMNVTGSLNAVGNCYITTADITSQYTGKPLPATTFKLSFQATFSGFSPDIVEIVPNADKFSYTPNLGDLNIDLGELKISKFTLNGNYSNPNDVSLTIKKVSAKDKDGREIKAEVKPNVFEKKTAKSDFTVSFSSKSENEYISSVKSLDIELGVSNSGEPVTVDLNGKVSIASSYIHLDSGIVL